MYDLTDPSPLVMTRFEKISTICAFAAVIALALWERFGPSRKRPEDSHRPPEPVE
jgi:hypothetical protein